MQGRRLLVIRQETLYSSQRRYTVPTAIIWWRSGQRADAAHMQAPPGRLWLVQRPPLTRPAGVYPRSAPRRPPHLSPPRAAHPPAQRSPRIPWPCWDASLHVTSPLPVSDWVDPTPLWWRTYYGQQCHHLRRLACLGVVPIHPPIQSNPDDQRQSAAQQA